MGIHNCAAAPTREVFRSYAEPAPPRVGTRNQLLVAYRFSFQKSVAAATRAARSTSFRIAGLYTPKPGSSSAGGRSERARPIGGTNGQAGDR